MSEIANEEQLTAQGEELDDFDVEGHGLKEIALGLSAATVVAGGAGAAALALDNPLPGTTSGIQTVVSGAQGDVEERRAWADRVADGALDRAGNEVDRTLRGVDRATTWAGTTATTTASPVTERVDATVAQATDQAAQAVKDTTDLAERTVADPIGTTDELVDGAMVTARDARDGAVGTAKDTVASAQTTAGGTVTTAQQTAADAAELATTTAGGVQEIINPQATVTMDDEGTTVQAGVAGTSVTVSTG